MTPWEDLPLGRLMIFRYTLRKFSKQQKFIFSLECVFTINRVSTHLLMFEPLLTMKYILLIHDSFIS